MAAAIEAELGVANLQVEILILFIDPHALK